MSLDNKTQKQIAHYMSKFKEISQKVSKSCCGSNSPYSLDLEKNPNFQARQVLENEIIMLLQDEVTLFNDISVRNVDNCEGKFIRLDSCQLGMEGDCIGGCLPTFGIEEDYLTYAARKYVSAFSVHNDMLECNLFGDRTTLLDLAMSMHMIAKRNTMEVASIQGDESIPVGTGSNAYNKVLGVNDGFLKLACNCADPCQIVDAGGRGPSRELFLRAISKVPTRYRSNLASWQFLVGPNIDHWWAYDVSNRPTDKGDDACATGRGGPMWGFNFYQVNQWPENYQYVAPDAPEGTPATAVTHALFTPLSNLIVINKNSFGMSDPVYDPACDHFLSVGRTWHDFMIRNPEELVIIKNLGTDGYCTPWEGCPVGPPCRKCDQSDLNPCPCE